MAREHAEESAAGPSGESGLGLSSAAELGPERDSDSDDDGAGFSPGPGSVWDEEEYEISPEDEAALAAFMRPGAKQRTLADVVAEKLAQAQG